MNKKKRMYAKIEKHGQNLNEIFKTKYDNVTLCKKLLRLETKAHRLATDYCNGDNGVTAENWDSLTNPILEKVNKILGNDDKHILASHVPIFINGDCRGYALKINDDYVRMCEKVNKSVYKDWGGYGILAPDFRLEA